MMKLHSCAIRALFAVGLVALASANQLPAQTTKSTYGQHLLEQAAAQHPGASGLEIRFPAGDSKARSLTWGKAAKGATTLPMQDVTGIAAGDLRVAFPASTILTPAQQRSTAEAIRNELRARTLSAGNLDDPYPWDAHLAQNTYGQHLVDTALSAHHDILVLGIHAKPGDDAPSAILASNFGRIGKADDEGDLKIVTSEHIESVIPKPANRCNIGLPLHTNLGQTIGLLTVAYAYAEGDDKAALIARATGVRDEISRRLLDRASILEPYPLDPLLAGHTYAQDLVDQVLLRHPHVAGAAFHVTPVGRKDNLILASTFGHIGKLSDESDLQMIRSGKHNMKVQPSGNRYSGELTLRDSARRTIGALLTIFPYKAGDDTAAMLVEAKQIRQELAAEIQNVAELSRQ